VLVLLYINKYKLVLQHIYFINRIMHIVTNWSEPLMLPSGFIGKCDKKVHFRSIGGGYTYLEVEGEGARYIFTKFNTCLPSAFETI